MKLKMTLPNDDIKQNHENYETNENDEREENEKSIGKHFADEGLRTAVPRRR